MGKSTHHFRRMAAFQPGPTTRRTLPHGLPTTKPSSCYPARQQPLSHPSSGSPSDDYGGGRDGRRRCLVGRRRRFSGDDHDDPADHRNRLGLPRRDVTSSEYQSLVVAVVYYRGFITATRHWLASRPACLTVSSLSSSLVFVARSILQMLSPVFTGCSLQAPERIKFKLAVTVYRAPRHCTSVLLVRPAAVRR